MTIKAIEQANFPELNDAFASQLGVKDIKELDTKIETLLNKKADEHLREAKREQVTEFLLSHHFEIPHSIIEKETQFRLQQMIQDPSFKKKWDESTEDQRRDLVNNVKNQAEKAVRIFYLCRKIAADQNMSVTPQDLPLTATEPLESLLYPTAQPHDPKQPDVKQAEAYSRVLLEKTEDWIIAHARTSKGGKKKAPEPQAEAEKPKRTPKKTAAKTEKPKPRKKAVSAPKKGKT